MVTEEIKEEPESRIKKWFEQLQTFRNPVPIVETKVLGETEIEAQIRKAAYYLALKHHSYEDLCWSLAEKIQKKNISTPSEEDIRQAAEEISNSSKTYDELCWLNAELEISTNK
ncbi:MAG: hypothetical protein ACFE9Q_14300 [Candidatus Hodarchaeota archaeon]